MFWFGLVWFIVLFCFDTQRFKEPQVIHSANDLNCPNISEDSITELSVRPDQVPNGYAINTVPAGARHSSHGEPRAILRKCFSGHLN